MTTPAGHEERLRTLLDELQGELQASQRLDEDARRELEEAVEHLRRVVDSGAEPGEAHEGAIGADEARTRLGEAIERFEASHPDLAALIGSVVNALSNMGI